MEQMNHLSLFSGMEAFVLGLRLAGLDIKTVGYCEYDKYCQEILRARIRDGYLDDAPIWPDVRTFDGRPFNGKVGILTAGFPCQPHSVAGKRAGADDERNLWPDTLRIIGEVGPSWVLLENVPGILTNGFGKTVVGQLSEIGYDCKWGIVSAADVGANHLRKRWWVLAYAKQPRMEGGTSEPSRRQRQYKPHQWDAMGQGLDSSGQVPDADGNGRSGRRRATEQERQYNALGWGQPPGADGEAGEVADAQRQGLERGAWGDVGSYRNPGLSRTQWWQVEPDVGRVVDGVAKRVDRLKTLGNGIVPPVVAEFLRRLQI